MPPLRGDFIIRGLTREGRRFRPSDWAERLCGIMSQFGGGRMSYSPHVYPVNSDGVKCVMVEAGLAELEPMAYHFLVGFARDNELQVSEVCAIHPEAAPAKARKGESVANKSGVRNAIGSAGAQHEGAATHDA
jgi:hypothetical protein